MLPCKISVIIITKKTGNLFVVRLDFMQHSCLYTLKMSLNLLPLNSLSIYATQMIPFSGCIKQLFTMASQLLPQ